MGERVGFIGLGIMGKPMAANLLTAGFPLTVHSRSPGPVDELVERRRRRGRRRRPRSHARATSSITMLPDTPDVEDVLLGGGGRDRGRDRRVRW